jgi:L-aspartate oxidase
MQKAFFVVPDYNEVRAGVKRIAEIMELFNKDEYALTPDYVEAESLATVAYLILKEALDAVT